MFNDCKILRVVQSYEFGTIFSRFLARIIPLKSSQQEGGVSWAGTGA